MKTLRLTLAALVLTAGTAFSNGNDTTSEKKPVNETADASSVIKQISDQTIVKIYDQNFKLIATAKFKNRKNIGLNNRISALIAKSNLMLENNNSLVYLLNK
jgi:hypothetical protein